jgi:hypothetical protein
VLAAMSNKNARAPAASLRGDLLWVVMRNQLAKSEAVRSEVRSVRVAM